MNRRMFLATVSAVGFTSLAGCANPLTTLFGDVRPESDPEPVRDELICEDYQEEDLYRYPSTYSEEAVHWGSLDGFSMRVNETAFEHGDSVQVTLTNTSPSTEGTGVKAMHNIEAYTEEGWQDVRAVLGDGVGFPMVLNNHRTGQGYEWEFEFTERGISTLREQGDYEVCPDLKSGRYRFIFWGIGDRKEAIAVAFDLHREM